MNNSVAWKVKSQDGFDGLILEEDLAIADNLGDYECMIGIEAASLNYRDITIAMVRSPCRSCQSCLTHSAGHLPFSPVSSSRPRLRRVRYGPRHRP
jgi:hypothetical protein